MVRLPEPLNWITIKDRIDTDDWQVFNKCLGDEETVKWIAVVERESGNLEGVPQFDREHLNVVDPQLLRNERVERCRQR